MVYIPNDKYFSTIVHRIVRLQRCFFISKYMFHIWSLSYRIIFDTTCDKVNIFSKEKPTMWIVPLAYNYPETLVSMWNYIKLNLMPSLTVKTKLLLVIITVLIITQAKQLSLKKLKWVCEKFVKSNYIQPSQNPIQNLKKLIK